MGLVVHHGVAPSVHPGAFVADGAWLIGDVVVGEESSIWYNAVLRGDINAIRIGRRTNIQDGCVLHVTRRLAVDIADGVTVGHMAMIHGCRIGSGALIGMNAVVLDDASVGEGALIAAGAVVKEGFVVPAGTLAAGVPARVVRELTAGERQAAGQTAANYVAYAASYRSHGGARS
ncbi:MAG TPA: gamma carbonic anhydrase family protein [Bacteroidota bacterium]|nr:gamma carbonic anhydrase family protein [Bacteroidota bacterium]